MGARGSGPRRDPRQRMRVYSFADSATFAARIAKLGALAHQRLDEHAFPDGESLVRAPAVVAPEALLVRTLDRPNAKLVEILLAADALRRAGAESVTLLAPYLPYMRQDAVFAAGDPLSQQVVGGLLAASFDAVFTVEAHLHRTRRLSRIAGRRSRSLSAAEPIRRWVARHARGAFLVGPDAESTPWIRAIAGAELPYAVGYKSRRGDRSVEIDLPTLPPGDRAVIVDDIASSGATLATAAELLRRRGVTHIDAVVVHAIFSPGAEETIRSAGVARIVSSDTIAHPTNAFSVAPVIAAALLDTPGWNLRRRGE